MGVKILLDPGHGAGRAHNRGFVGVPDPLRDADGGTVSGRSGDRADRSGVCGDRAGCDEDLRNLLR